MSGEYNLGDFEKGEMLKKQMTFGRLFKPGSAIRDSLGLYFNEIIDRVTLQEFIKSRCNLKSSFDIENKWLIRLHTVCLSIIQSDEIFELGVFELIFDQFSNDVDILTALAKNPNISLELAEKLCKPYESNETNLALASNLGEELTLRFFHGLYDPFPFYLPSEIEKAVKENIEKRTIKLVEELSRSAVIFGGKENETIVKNNFIDLTRSIRACNDLGEFINSIPITPNNLITDIVKYEEVKHESILDLLNSNNPESLIGVVARIKEFFAEFVLDPKGLSLIDLISPFKTSELLWTGARINTLKSIYPLWKVASKLNEDFIISVKDLVKSDINTYWCGNRRFESEDIDLHLKVVTIINANFPQGKKVFKQGQAYKANLEKVFNGLFDVVSDGAFRVAFDLKELNLANDAYTQEIKVNFDGLVMYRDIYKHILAELQKTKLPSAEDLELEKMKQLAEQKLIAEGPLAIAQREFDENLASIGDPLEYVKSEMLRRMHEKTMEIDEKFRIQPFLQSFWDEINQNTFELEQLKSFRPPKNIINEDGKQVLETQEESKSAFFRLIGNLFIGNGKITRALNPDSNLSIPSPQSQIKDFYNQLNAKYLPASILDETGKTINTKEVDNNIFNNPELNIPKVYLEILFDLLEKLRMKYKVVLEERVEFEKNKTQNSLVVNIRKERLKINQGVDVSISTLIQKEIKKILVVQNALETGIQK
jgi:hypothetical protein